MKNRLYIYLDIKYSLTINLALDITMRGVVNGWFKTHLSGRFQYISVNGVNKLTAVTYGVHKDLHGDHCFYYVNDR